MTQAERLKEVRRELRLTQQELGEKLKMSGAAISEAERGRTGVSSNLMRRLRQTFEVNPAWLLTGEGTMFLTDVNQAEESEASYGSDAALQACQREKALLQEQLELKDEIIGLLRAQLKAR